jgi:subtilase family serine protease
MTTAMPSRAWILIVVVAAIVALAVSRVSGGPARQTPVTATSDAGAAVVLGPTDPSTAIRFSLVLHQPGAAELDRFLVALQTPGSADYHRFVDAATYGRRYGLADADLQALEGWVGAVGLTPVRTFAQRTQMVVSGPASLVESLFHVGLVDVRDAASLKVFHRPDGSAAIPAAIAGLVDGVADLSDRPPRLSMRKAIPDGAARPVDLAAAYDITPMYQAGLKGDGVSVAVVSFCSHLDADISAFEKAYQLESPPTGRALENVRVGQIADCDDRLEPSGDIEIVRAIAPHANVLNFQSAYTDSQAEVIDAIVADGRATIVTDSYGWCYDHISAADRAAGIAALRAAVGHGVSVFVASGDWGAYDCYSTDRHEHQLSVDWPSSTVYTVAVGGTRLSVRTDGAYYAEDAWQDYLQVGGTGGGLNPVEDRPAWQHGPGVDNGASNGKRQSPDLAASADIASPYSVYATPVKSNQGGLTAVWGTSMSSPLWAAVTALLQQHVADEGLTWPGFIDPMLYDIAATVPPNTAFHDIVRGNNLYADATSGWDYATGLGSPDVAALDRAVIDYLGR